MTTLAPRPTGRRPAPVPHVPAGAGGAPPAERRRSIRTREPDELLAAAGSAVGAVALVWLVYERLVPFEGALGFFVLWYVTFVGLYGLVVAQRHTRPIVVDKVMAVLMYSAGLLVVGVLVLIIGYTLFRGWRAVVEPQFLLTDFALASPDDPLNLGGVLHGIIGTLSQIGIAVAISVPLGLTAAVFLNEIGGSFARPVRTLVEAMSAIPSIIAGLFVYAGLVIFLGFDQSGFAASCAIAVMMLPIVTRASEVVLRLVPSGLREASYALGVSQWQTVWRVVLPTARPGLATAIVLAMARGIGETAPVLLTAGFTKEFNLNPLQDAQVSMPLIVYWLVRQPSAEAVARGFGAAFVLLVLVLVLFVTARLLGGRAPARR